MVSRDLLAAKLVELADRIERARSHCPATLADLRANRDALDLVAFNLMLSVQSAADIASHLIADEGWPAASTLAQGFERLHEHGILTRATADALGRAVGLRNVVAHGYAGIDAAMVFAAGTEGVRDLEAFAHELGAWLQASGDGLRRPTR